SRTAALAFLIDLSGDNYLEAFDVLIGELGSFSPELPRKRRIILGTKLDLEESAGRLEKLRDRYPAERVRGISVFSGEGLPELAADLVRLADEGSADVRARTAAEAAGRAAGDGAGKAAGAGSGEDPAGHRAGGLAEDLTEDPADGEGILEEVRY
ncbi:MAG: GTPase ObgE, partial [Treponema sp.]|nr:GTPase ObgE [Treponema sp.]